MDFATILSCLLQYCLFSLKHKIGSTGTPCPFHVIFLPLAAQAILTASAFCTICTICTYCTRGIPQQLAEAKFECFDIAPFKKSCRTQTK